MEKGILTDGIQKEKDMFANIPRREEVKIKDYFYTSLEQTMISTTIPQAEHCRSPKKPSLHLDINPPIENDGTQQTGNRLIFHL